MAQYFSVYIRMRFPITTWKNALQYKCNAKKAAFKIKQYAFYSDIIFSKLILVERK